MRYTFAGLMGGGERKFRILPGGGSGGPKLIRTASKGGSNVIYMSVTNPAERERRMKWIREFMEADDGQLEKDTSPRSKLKLVKGGKRKPRKKKS